MHKARSKKPQSKLRFWLLVLIMLLTGIVATLFSSPQARHLLRAQLNTPTPPLQYPPTVSSYWPDVYKDIYISASGGTVTNVYQNPLKVGVSACSIQCTTTPLPDYYVEKFAAECKALHRYDPWYQTSCAAAKLHAYYDTTKTDECCRNYALDMQKIVRLLSWGDTEVMVGIQYLGMDKTDQIKPGGHVFNQITTTIHSGVNAGKTFSFMYDAGWFPGHFFPADLTTKAYYDSRVPSRYFPYYNYTFETPLPSAPSTPAPSAPTPVPIAPPEYVWRTWF